MAKPNGELLVRIDERVKTVFNDMKFIKSEIISINTRHNQCQIEVLPKMKSKIAKLDDRPIGMTAFFTQILKGLFR